MSDDSPAKGANVTATLFNSKIEEEAGKVVGVIFGGAAEGAMSVGGNIFGGLIGDRVREWRTRNLVARMADTAKFLKKKGVSLDKARSIPMGEAYAMFEESSKQDDPTVASMWSALLANAMDANCNVTIEPAIISTLKVLNGREANILKFIQAFRAAQAVRNDNISEIYKISDIGLARSKIEMDAKIRFNETCQDLFKDYFNLKLNDEVDFSVSLSHLIKEGCICIHAPSFSRRDLVANYFVEGMENVEFLDASRVCDALNGIARSVDEHSGRTNKIPELFLGSRFYLEISYDLTAYGLHLLRVCEPIISPTKPTE